MTLTHKVCIFFKNAIKKHAFYVRRSNKMRYNDTYN
jgi:hypothetical protein